MSTLKVNAITETDGTAFPFGKIIQVQTQTIDTTVSSTNNTTEFDTGITKAITPIKAGSSIFVLPAVAAKFKTTSDNSNVFDLILKRDIASGGFSDIHIFEQIGNEATRTSSRITQTLVHNLPIVDSPSYSLGQTITYKVAGDMYTSGGGMTLSINFPNNDRTGTQARMQSTLTLMEIEA